jgi:hypothetical protein
VGVTGVCKGSMGIECRDRDMCRDKSQDPDLYRSEIQWETIKEAYK